MRKHTVDLGSKFQSLTGRLKTIRRVSVATWASVFQSLTGRLKTSVLPAQLNTGYAFQSLTGRLKTDDGGRERQRIELSFNPSQVG